MHAERGSSGESVDGVEVVTTGERTRHERERDLDKPAGDKGAQGTWFGARGDQLSVS